MIGTGNYITFRITPWRRVPFQKLTVSQLISFPAYEWNSKFCYLVYKLLPRVCFLSQMNAVALPPVLFL